MLTAIKLFFVFSLF
jgi:hypothetical protein